MSESVAVELPLEPASARRAREELESIRGGMDERLFIDLRIIVSELVVEALSASRDAGESLMLRAELVDDRVRVEVSEGSAAYWLRSPNAEPGEVGWGLSLVTRLSSRWGFLRDSQRATVWLDLPLNPI